MRDSATTQLTSQKDRAIDGLGSVAQAVRSSTQQLRDGHHETAAGYVDQIANQIERLSRGLREKDVTELLDDAQRLARRQPAVFIASAFAAGVVAARFLKSSAPDQLSYRDASRGVERNRPVERSRPRSSESATATGGISSATSGVGRASGGFEPGEPSPVRGSFDTPATARTAAAGNDAASQSDRKGPRNRRSETERS
jgi:hypothetical protein